MDEVVIVMGAHAIGKPLQEVCHKLTMQILKCDADKIVTATDIQGAYRRAGYAVPIQETISMDENFRK